MALSLQKRKGAKKIDGFVVEIFFFSFCFQAIANLRRRKFPGFSCCNQDTGYEHLGKFPTFDSDFCFFLVGSKRNNFKNRDLIFILVGF
jgi:hypothetical protein